MNVVVTLSIAADGRNEAWMAAGLPSKQAYSKRIGADLVNITERQLGGSPANEKYQIGKLLDEYDRVFYLDADLVIDPSAPNIFEVVSEGCFGIFDESTYLAPDGGRKERTALTAWLRDGFPGCRCPWYANNGVFVCSKEHLWLFDPSDLSRSTAHAWEQTVMNHRLWEATQQDPPRVKIHWLSMAWNWMPRTWVGGQDPGWVPEPCPDPCWVSHFPCHRPEERLAAMAALNRRYGL
jgi:hypothetical protein